MNKLQNQLNELRKIFNQLLERKFPKDTALSEELSELHDELLMFDSDTAGLLLRVINGKSLEQFQLVKEERLRAKLQVFQGDSNSEMADCASSYLERLQLLEAGIDCALECIKLRGFH